MNEDKEIKMRSIAESIQDDMDREQWVCEMALEASGSRALVSDAKVVVLYP